ncbi:SDR family NAD(P)-dependent oxidoreductase [Paenibacillus antarcticus]|uniref:3-ketoacyl-ACP reductase n=1 Tax=Paenibacillus antarcticus TaxID=253703 RepID=A0A162K5M4_9BACL|nr:glucose 1-dehydrogenase [Paenibacillus antarcticus]OAB41088.1 3-ketoacyl-ACP reductase [Paenibacillus antarcticus]
MSYKNKVVVITGAAQGIGQGIAQMYASRGACVTIGDVDTIKGELTVACIREAGGRALFVACDVRSEEEIQKLMALTVEEFGTIDILINNAGVSRFKSPFELTVEEWDDCLNTNARSCFLATREAAKIMKSQGRVGSVVNISSTRSTMSEPHSEAYAASKGAILALSHAMAISLGKDGIRVNSISPGWIQTHDYTALSARDHEQHPAGRVGTPEDVARTCLYLTDPDNSFITGTNIVLDGGMTRKMIYEE